MNSRRLGAVTVGSDIRGGDVAGYWTLENRVEILREAWERAGIQAARPLFPDQTDEQIRGAARRYRIRCENRLPQKKQTLTPLMEAELRREYRTGARPDLKGLADRLNVRYDWLKWQAGHLGLSHPVRGPGWSAAEDAILEAGIEAGHTPQTISRKLQKAGFYRGSASIVNRKETLRWKVTRDKLSAREIADFFGVDHRAVTRWIHKGWLPAKRGTGFYAGATKTLPDPDQQNWAVSYKNLRKFMLRHPNEWDPRRIRQEILLDILCGPNWSRQYE